MPATRRKAACVAAIWLTAALIGCSSYDPHLLPERRVPSRQDAGSKATDAAIKTVPDASMVSVMTVVTCTADTELSICEPAHADGVCVDSQCKIIRCRDGFLDCDHDVETGCEASLDTPENCGACGASCDLNHVARSLCQMVDGMASCGIDHTCGPDAPTPCAENATENGCEPGFGDCDGMAANGCETSLTTMTDCGGCGMACKPSGTGTEARCATGTCMANGCAEGFADCGQGCISLANDPAHCGKCNQACPSSTASMCSGGRCTSVTCLAGHADCNGKASDGCETDLGAAGTCGSCDVGCGPYANGSPGCSAGQCSVSCNMGFADCNKDKSDGCETDLSNADTCGACGMDCNGLPHVTSAQCAGGQCAQLNCMSGFGDCDGNPANGCEQSLNTNDHCGSCSGTCNPANATGTCQSGSCAVSACTGGFDDCDGNPGNGCEASLDSSAHCGRCNNACQGGTSCQNGGCTCSGTSCPSGQTCCGGSCIDASGNCYPWPCIPGTTRDKNNCGGCGTQCGLWCCI